MTERERLIELVKQSLIKHIDKTCKLAENITEDLLANGVIVPPCMVGDMVYRIGEGNAIIKALVSDWKKESDGDWLFRAFYSVNGSASTILFSDRNIGKTVFLTREEAEKALEERGKS